MTHNSRFITIGLVVLVSLLNIKYVLADDSSSDQQVGGNLHPHRHRHRHHHHHQSENSQVTSDGDVDFVAAYRVIDAPTRKEDEDNTSFNSLESRLESLEQDVTNLCLEDAEDVDRQIRALGVKCRCPKTEAPVCGSDDVTYYNRCFLHCRAEQAKMSYHRYKITLKKFGRC